MRAFVTGATGFIGGRLAHRLRERGDEVVALVRSPAKVARLRGLGCELVEGDLTSVEAIGGGVEGCDAVFHAAAIYRVGIRGSERPAMFEANVRGTERVLDAAIDAGVKRIVYVSTNNNFGDTHGQVVDETYERPLDREGFLSAYDETKYLSHKAAEERIASGAPIVIVQPGGVYGPGDTSQLGEQMRQAAAGKLRFVSFPTLGLNFVHVDDVVDGILLAHDRGESGEAYVLGGEIATMRELIEKAAEVSGRKPPRLVMPSALIRMLAPLAPLLAGRLGQPPNLRELLSVSDGVTYWASDRKARERLGYSPRDLETGLTQTFAS